MVKTFSQNTKLYKIKIFQIFNKQKKNLNLFINFI